MKKYFGSPLIEYLPAVGFLVFTITYLGLAYSYEADARAFPSIVACVMLVLTLLDLVSRSKTNIGALILRLVNPAGQEDGPARGVKVTPAKQIIAILWVFGFAALLFVIGILYAVPIYAFVSMWFRSKLSFVLSVSVAALITLAIWLLFGLALRITFYQGIELVRDFNMHMRALFF
jgi:hypothetical protein